MRLPSTFSGTYLRILGRILDVHSIFYWDWENQRYGILMGAYRVTKRVQLWSSVVSRDSRQLPVTDSRRRITNMLPS